jgi:hypothetical protein
MEVKTLVKEVVLDNINLEGMASALILKALDPALEKLVQDSKNPFDNVLKAAVAPELFKLLKAELDQLIAKIRE